jgi:cyclase
MYVSDGIRLIARLDIKGENLIKGVHLEGLRVVGSPNEHALRYYHQGADELVFMDTVASLYGRNHLGEIIKAAAQDIFVPITVGGGIRSVENAVDLLQCGADKVAINTAAIANPQLIRDIAERLGSQAITLSIEAKQISDCKWEAYTENGREPSGVDVVEWAKRAVGLGAGEILLTSVDKEGTRKGYDVALVQAVASKVAVPVIASGGMGKPEDMFKAIEHGADAVAMADILHFKRSDIQGIRDVAARAGLKVRRYEQR